MSKVISQKYWQEALSNIFRYRGTVFNAAFLGFFILIQPLLYSRVINFFEVGQADYLLGGIILIAIVLEHFGFMLKVPAAMVRIDGERPRYNYAALNLGFWALRLLIIVFMSLSLVRFFGLDQNFEWLYMVILLGLILKEMYLWPYAFAGEDYVSFDPAERARNEFLGDLLMFSFSALSFSCIWSIPHSHYAQNQYFLSAVIFLVVFLAVRMIYLIEEICLIRNWRDGLTLAGGVIINLIMAVLR